jgi:hypothetical protein
MSLIGANVARRNCLFLDDFSEVPTRSLTKCVVGIFDRPAPPSVRLSEIAEIAPQASSQLGRIRSHRDEPDIADLQVTDDGQCLEGSIQQEPATALAKRILKIELAREGL